jgi:hypothetical protein
MHAALECLASTGGRHGSPIRILLSTVWSDGRNAGMIEGVVIKNCDTESRPLHSGQICPIGPYAGKPSVGTVVNIVDGGDVSCQRIESMRAGAAPKTRAPEGARKRAGFLSGLIASRLPGFPLRGRRSGRTRRWRGIASRGRRPPSVRRCRARRRRTARRAGAWQQALRAS